MPRDRYPMLVTFEDVSDPASVKLVDPDNLAAIFGDGIRLKEITLALGKPAIVARKNQNILPWLPFINTGYQLDGSRYRSAAAVLKTANMLGVGSFSTEIVK